MGDIVDGTYELRATAREVVTVLRRLGREEVLSLRSTLELVQSAKTDADARGAVDQLPETVRKLVRPDSAAWRDNVGKVLQIIIILLTIWYGQKAVEGAPHPVAPQAVKAAAQQISDSELTNIVQQAIREAEQSDQPLPLPKKPPRNSRCYCGSGKKYKFCHGADPGSHP
jgi:uncharacterized protein YecA (UPF0149 family)